MLGPQCGSMFFLPFARSWKTRFKPLGCMTNDEFATFNLWEITHSRKKPHNPGSWIHVAFQPSSGGRFQKFPLVLLPWGKSFPGLQQPWHKLSFRTMWSFSAGVPFLILWVSVAQSFPLTTWLKNKNRTANIWDLSQKI